MQLHQKKPQYLCKGIQMDKLFLEDKIANNNPSFFRKKYWVLYSLRKEQSASSVFSQRFWALIKKCFLAGTGCELPSIAFGGGAIRFPHLNGIIINPNSRVGSNCTIFHQVTIGVAREGDGAPTIGDRAFIGAGAKLLGPIQIGDDVYVGANAIVTKNVPSNVTVVGANKIISKQ